MTGFEAAYVGRPLTNIPDELAAALETFNGSSVVLGLRQGRASALEEALKTLADDQADIRKQLDYVQILGEVNQPECVPSLVRLATTSSDNALRTASLNSLARYDSAGIDSQILNSYANMSDDVRAAADALLATRATWTLRMLQAIDTGKIDKTQVPMDIVQRMMRFTDLKITNLVRKHWPDLRAATSTELQSEIDRIDKVLRSGVGLPKPGQQLFMNQCGKCHTLFGKGGKVGPDLTAFKRDDLRTMLISIVNPNAEIREGFDTYLVVTSDGRTLTGTLAEQDSQIVVLRSPEGAMLSIQRSEIDDITISKQSMMPEGLLKQYSDQQLRDLFGYLRITQPLIK